MEAAMNKRLVNLAWLPGLALLCCPAAGADTVYKCVLDGKTNFTSDPKTAKGECQPMELHVSEPNPVDVARQLEKNREYAEDMRAEAARRRKQPDADAAFRAQSAEMAKSLAKAPVPSPWAGGSSRGRRGSR
jgi:hypothetical protein